MAGSGPTRGSNSAHQEWLIDEALRETFPASDPISPATPRKRYRVIVATDFSTTSVAAVDRAARHVSLADEITNTVRYSLPEPAALAAGRGAIRAA